MMKKLLTILIVYGILCVSVYAAGSKDDWAAAQAAGKKYNVSATLLVAIRTHENPRRCNDYKACGVKDPTGKQKWWPGGLQGQYMGCAKIVARVAKGHKWDAMKPTRAAVSHLGTHYAEGSLSWGRSVWSIYSRMAGK